MAVVNRKSEHITNADATPVVLTSATASRGDLKEAIGLITPATDDSATSVHRLVRVPSNCRVSQLLVTAADFTTGGAADFGVYYASDKNAGAVIDVDFFASAYALTAGPIADLTTIINESATNTPAKQVQPLWQAVGLTADPQCEFDIAATITTDYNGGQPVLVKVRYVT